MFPQPPTPPPIYVTYMVMTRVDISDILSYNVGVSSIYSLGFVNKKSGNQFSSDTIVY